MRDIIGQSELVCDEVRWDEAWGEATCYCKSWGVDCVSMIRWTSDIIKSIEEMHWDAGEWRKIKGYEMW